MQGPSTKVLNCWHNSALSISVYCLSVSIKHLLAKVTGLLSCRRHAPSSLYDPSACITSGFALP